MSGNKWENDFFVTNGDKKTVCCMICDQLIYKRGYDMKRHSNVKHFAEYGGLDLSQKTAMLANIKIAYNLRIIPSTSQNEVNFDIGGRAKLKASFVVSHAIAVV